MFVYEDEQPRVSAPILSPDGQHILVTEGFSQGSVVFNATSLNLDTLGIGHSGSETNELGIPSLAQMIPGILKLPMELMTSWLRKLVHRQSLMNANDRC